jgi:hypothetical protein
VPPDFFENAMKLIVVFGVASVVVTLVGIGIKTAFFRRASKEASVIDSDELQAIQERLQTTETKVFELEERLDFAERLLTEARAKGQLPKP